MPHKRPFGITIYASLFTLIGAFTSFVIFFEIIDSMRFLGLRSILITNMDSFAGFLLYGGTPVLWYSTGIGLFMLRPWARKLTLFVVTPMSALLAFNSACNIARTQSIIYQATVLDLFVTHFDVFIDIAIKYAVIFLPMIVYFNHPNVVISFSSKE